jgi:membrane protein YdbS with pleckstrin-like domain
MFIGKLDNIAYSMSLRGLLDKWLGSTEHDSLLIKSAEAHMGYVDSQLLPGENVIYRSKLHWQVFLLPGFFACILLFASIGLFVTEAKGVGLFLLVLAGFLVLVPFIKRANSEFAVTNKRIVVKLGFFTTRTVELLHSKVETISVNQGLLGKMLGFGDIVVTGSGGTREEFKAVASPLELRRAVQAASTSVT